MQLAVAGRVRAIERIVRLQRRLEWHILRPHADKSFPSLEAFLGDDDSRSAKPQSADEMQAAMAAWAARGGIVRTYPPGHPLHKP